jgi:hypothetical protein
MKSGTTTDHNVAFNICMLTITNTANLKYGSTETKCYVPLITSPETHE